MPTLPTTLLFTRPPHPRIFRAPYGPELVQGYVYVFSITAATANTVMLIAITIACRKNSDYPQQKRPLKMTFLFGKCSACLPP